MHQGMCWREWPCTYGVCKRAVGCFGILKVFLHASQVYVLVRLKILINLLLWLMCFLWLPSLPHFLKYILILVQPTEFVYLPKYHYQS